MPLFRPALRLLLLLALVAAPARARAEEDAKTLYKRGTALFALRKFEAAAALYEKAFELHNEPAILYNAAQAYRLAGNKARALELYQSLLQIYGSGFPNAAEASQHIKNLRKAIDADRHAAGSPPVVPMNVPKTSEPPPPPAVVAPPAAVIATSTAPPPTKPLTRRGWFWGVVAGSAAVVVAGVAVGVVLGTAKTVPPTPTFGTIQGD